MNSSTSNNKNNTGRNNYIGRKRDGDAVGATNTIPSDQKSHRQKNFDEVNNDNADTDSRKREKTDQGKTGVNLASVCKDVTLEEDRVDKLMTDDDAFRSYIAKKGCIRTISSAVCTKFNVENQSTTECMTEQPFGFSPQQEQYNPPPSFSKGKQNMTVTTVLKFFLPMKYGVTFTIRYIHNCASQTSIAQQSHHRKVPGSRYITESFCQSQ